MEYVYVWMEYNEAEYIGLLWDNYLIVWLLEKNRIGEELVVLIKEK